MCIYLLLLEAQLLSCNITVIHCQPFELCVLSNRDLVDEAKDFHLMPERRPHLPAFKTRQRCCTSIAGLIYAVGGLNSAGTLLTSPVVVPMV